jgi:glycine/sarcosine N-methyltransferase
MSKTAFDDLSDYYEAMIDWSKRLANEGPFYQYWFEKIGVQSVVDVACGTGRHAAMFHEWGLKVEGADISPAMIARARANFGEDKRLHWIVRGFEQAIERETEENGIFGQQFDAAICTGNSLALALDEKTAEQAIRKMFAAVRPGGLVIIQVLNLWQLSDGPCVWQKCKKVSPLPVEAGPGVRAEESDVLIVKGIHRSGHCGYVDFLIASPTDGKLLHHESVPFLGLESTQLEKFAHQSGARSIDFFGDYRQQPYEREKSVDLIMVAEK